MNVLELASGAPDVAANVQYCQQQVATQKDSSMYDNVKVFSATKAKDREVLGDRVTEWLRTNAVEIVNKVVRLSSDAEFHCLSITLFYRTLPGQALAPSRT